MPRTVQRSLRAGAATLAVAGLALLGGCGDQQAGGPGMSSSTSPGGSVSASATDRSVTVTVDDGNGSQQTWDLSCSADGVVAGDHPDAQNACAAIAAAKQPWAPVPKDAACTMIYGGPQTATVEGTWDGVEVDASFNRKDGCEIARWDRLAPLLQPGTPAGRGGSGGAT